MKKQRIDFKCPYEKVSCPYVDTLTSTLDGNCKTCKHYHNGTRATGSMEGLE